MGAGSSCRELVLHEDILNAKIICFEALENCDRNARALRIDRAPLLSERAASAEKHGGEGIESCVDEQCANSVSQPSHDDNTIV
eukprot:2719801-Pleurochrysis_carterae.AAC.2